LNSSFAGIPLGTSWIRSPQPARSGHFWGPYSAFRPHLGVAVRLERPRTCASRPGRAFPGRSFCTAGADNADRAAGQVMIMAMSNLVVGGLPSLIFN
jgi:hypothetical protein